MKRNTPTNGKAGHPTKSEPANDNAGKCTGCTCAAQGSIRLDDETLRAVFFGQMVAAFEKHNMEVMDRTGHEDMSLAHVFESAAELADLMLDDVQERGVK